MPLDESKKQKEKDAQVQSLIDKTLRAGRKVHIDGKEMENPYKKKTERGFFKKLFGIKENAPTCAMGGSSSTSGPLTMFDPALGRKRKKYSSFLQRKKLT